MPQTLPCPMRTANKAEGAKATCKGLGLKACRELLELLERLVENSRKLGLSSLLHETMPSPVCHLKPVFFVQHHALLVRELLNCEVQLRVFQGSPSVESVLECRSGPGQSKIVAKAGAGLQVPRASWQRAMACNAEILYSSYSSRA